MKNVCLIIVAIVFIGFVIGNLADAYLYRKIQTDINEVVAECLDIHTESIARIINTNDMQNDSIKNLARLAK